MKERIIPALLLSAALAGCVRAPMGSGDCTCPAPAKTGTEDPSGRVTVLETPAGDPALAAPYEPDGWAFGNRRAPTEAADAKKKPFDIEALYASAASPRQGSPPTGGRSCSRRSRTS